ncbi:TraB/GumN family protein [Dyella tabacisoli]|uniref:TraB/GumN family protein n=1 Tax=Dyella tabacisoli TaxID=2282381 RepID=A0A369UNQ6_9GAMM|nr:TraB/GumN family protein [Dyella tabacisoli]RDD81685.1 TraB/GumN family protein [Dyella tabacisoli]
MFQFHFPRRWTASLLSVLLLTLAIITPAVAHPALWIAKNEHATVYLFGTVHLLPSETDWSSPQLDEALKHSQRLSIELVDDDVATMQALVLKFGLDMAHPLSSKLSAADQEKLQQAAATAQLPGGVSTLQPMRPWLAALTLAMAPLVQAGLNPDLGVDKLLKDRMQKAGKPVDGLETAEQQIGLLAHMSEPMQLDFLRQTFSDVAEGPAKLRELIDAWKNGDVAAIAGLADNELRQQSPALYQRLIVARNKAWAKIIAERMQQPGVSFVAVGAGHLAGPDSLQTQLEAQGITTTLLR